MMLLDFHDKIFFTSLPSHFATALRIEPLLFLQPGWERPSGLVVDTTVCPALISAACGGSIRSASLCLVCRRRVWEPQAILLLSPIGTEPYVISLFQARLRLMPRRCLKCVILHVRTRANCCRIKPRLCQLDFMIIGPSGGMNAG